MFNIKNAAPTNMCTFVLVLDLLSSISSWPSNLSTNDPLTARLLPGLWYSLYLHCIFITIYQGLKHNIVAPPATDQLKLPWPKRFYCCFQNFFIILFVLGTKYKKGYNLSTKWLQLADLQQKNALLPWGFASIYIYLGSVFIFYVYSIFTVRQSNFQPTIIIIRDETIRSPHDTIHIDTRGDDMVIFDTIRYG